MERPKFSLWYKRKSKMQETEQEKTIARKLFHKKKIGAFVGDKMERFKNNLNMV